MDNCGVYFSSDLQWHKFLKKQSNLSIEHKQYEVQGFPANTDNSLYKDSFQLNT